MMSRQERRARLRAAAQKAVKDGIAVQAQHGGLQETIGLAKILIDILEGSARERASDAAREANRVFDRSLDRYGTLETPACGRGCAFCCHTPVSATAPEVLLIATELRRLRMTQEMASRINAADEITREIGFVARYTFRHACPLLVDSICSVYTARPAACRGMNSTSADACRASFENEKIDITKVAEPLLLRGAHGYAMLAALQATGYPPEFYELNHALRLAIQTPDAEERWLDGQNIFVDVEKDHGEQNNFEREESRRMILDFADMARGKLPLPS